MVDYPHGYKNVTCTFVRNKKKQRKTQKCLGHAPGVCSPMNAICWLALRRLCTVKNCGYAPLFIREFM